MDLDSGSKWLAIMENPGVLFGAGIDILELNQNTIAIETELA